MTVIDETIRAAAVEGTRELAASMAKPDAIPLEFMISEPGVYDQIPAEHYYRDPVVGGSLSNSGAKLLASAGGPARFAYWRDHPDEETKKSFDMGRAAHQEVLGDLEDRIVVVGGAVNANGNTEWRTNAAKDEVAKVRAAGMTPIKPEEMKQVKAMAAAIRQNPLAARLLHADSGDAEQTLVWRDKPSGVMCRARVDWLRYKRRGYPFVLVDFKTTTKLADSVDFGRSTIDYGYYVQDWFYSEGARALELDPEPEFVFVVQETKPPYLVNVLQLPAEARNIGQNYARYAMHRYAECTKSGQWPGYPDKVDQVDVPGWWLNRHDEDPRFMSKETTEL